MILVRRGLTIPQQENRRMQMHQERSKLGVAIVGCGTVGGAVATLLTRDADILRARLAPQRELRHIVDVDVAHASELLVAEGVRPERMLEGDDRLARGVAQPFAYGDDAAAALGDFARDVGQESLRIEDSLGQVDEMRGVAGLFTRQGSGGGLEAS